MNIEFTLASEREIPLILEMMQDFYKHEGIPFDEEKSRATLRDFLTRKNAGKIWIIQYNNNQAGYCCLIYGYSLEYHGPDCFLDEIYIKPQFQNKGIGKKTLGFLDSFARKQDIRAINLFVFDTNRKAFDIYLKNGYTKRNGNLMVKILQ